jgi:phosphoglycolate phosphatase-like HAD superfamily hydrolase
MIGDSEHDVEAGKNAGCRTIQLINDSKSLIDRDVVASSLLDGVLKLLVQPPLFAATVVDFG